MILRLRTIAMVAVPVILIGGGIWFFASGTPDGAVGAGGLPLIKADVNPVKLPPDEPGGEIMPNADSTVFSAIGAGEGTDPSMQNLRLPEIPAAEPPAVTSDFAGLKTGFAVPAEPGERKVESLFDTAPKTANVEPVAEAAPEAPAESKYVSGMVPEEPAKAEAPVEPAAEAVAEPAVEPIVEPEVKKPVIAEKADDAQDMEAQEKAFATPAPVATAKPVAKPAMKIEPIIKKQTAEKKTDTPRPPVAEATKARVTDAAKTVADDVAKETANAAYVPPAKKTEAAAPASSGAYYIQLSSMPAGGNTAAMWSRLRGMYAGPLAGLSPSYQNASVPGKGEYVRIQAGPLSQSEANNRCRALRQQDPSGGCLVVRR